MLPELKTGVWISMGLAAIALAWMVVRTGEFRDDPQFARTRGNRWTGILYAFGPAMMPWHKESAGRHLITYVTGIVYHVGIFAALAFLVVRLIPLEPSAPTTTVLNGTMVAGMAAGLLLLVKRLAKPAMRAISCPDDFAANLVVTLFLALGSLVALARISPEWWFITAILLFLYIPLGKIRHCAFFFTTRILYGTFFGRRGVFPDTTADGGERMKP